MALIGIKDYIPDNAFNLIDNLLREERLVLKIKNERKTRHGDYRQLPDGSHQITVNANLNNYKFLITLVHEIAHLKAYKEFGRFIKPHGKEWKYTFKTVMLPFLNPSVFPNDLLPILARHFMNPKASSDTDNKLALALKAYDEPNNKTCVMSILEGTSFKLYNGKVFVRGKQRRKRIECQEKSTGRLYLFNPLAEVELLD